MAGDYIPYTTNLHQKPKVMRIAKTTGRSRFEVSGLLMAFWSWASEHTEDGALQSVSVDDLSEIVGGDSVFWDAVASVGWIEINGANLCIPKFTEWMGKAAKTRLEDRQRKRLKREADPENNWKDSGMQCPEIVQEKSDKNRTQRNESKENESSKKRVASFFKKTSPEDLKSNSEVERLFTEAAKQTPPIVDGSEDGRLKFFTAVVCALEKGKNPVGFLVDLVHEGRWGWQSIAQEDSARKRIKQLRAQPPPATPDESQDVVKKSLAGIFRKQDAHGEQPGSPPT